MLRIIRLISAYRNSGVLIDTNLLLLLFVGLAAKDMISRHKRTVMFAPEDFEVLDEFVARFDLIVVTPNILTEAVNLARQCAEPLRGQIFECIAEYVPRMKEEFIESSGVVGSDGFQRLGITDAGIALLAVGKYLVLTDDLRLTSHLASLDVDCINFNHLRPNS